MSYRNGHISTGFKAENYCSKSVYVRNNPPSLYLYLLSFAVNFEDGKGHNTKEVLKISLGSLQEENLPGNCKSKYKFVFQNGLNAGSAFKGVSWPLPANPVYECAIKCRKNPGNFLQMQTHFILNAFILILPLSSTMGAADGSQASPVTV